MPHLAHFARRAPILTAITLLLLAGCSHSLQQTAPTNPTPAPPKAPPADAGPAKPVVAAPPHFDKPDHVRGIYLTAWSAGSKKKRAAVYAMLKNTQLNSVVIDVRDTGEMYFKTGIKLATAAKANDIAVTDAPKLMRELAEHKVYPIARVACFRDNMVPKKFPGRAVQVAGGKVWRDRSGHSWLDPYNKDNWDYIAATVDYALDIGFPEIQLDYVRFPSEGKSRTQRFPGQKKYPDAKAKPEDVIASFADFISQRVRARHAVVSADIFGIISSTKGDEGIGQELEKVAKPFDVISPMVYPSHFAAGEYGIKYPVAEPYQILSKSLADYKKRLPKTAIRPWLQDFSLREPGQPLVHYGVTEIQAEIKAAHDSGYDDFLMWNAANRYTDAAYVTLP
ncbi:MAG TPA: putative glycoside hydrolase [Fimbriimonadaceae bacterium]|nr:putative glycoside hydrolase [Fimbriimonadaceae bacterium]